MREVQGEDSPIEHGKIQPKCCGKFCATQEAVLDSWSTRGREDSDDESRRSPSSIIFLQLPTLYIYYYEQQQQQG